MGEPDDMEEPCLCPRCREWVELQDMRRRNWQLLCRDCVEADEQLKEPPNA